MLTEKEQRVVYTQYSGCRFDSRLPNGTIVLRNADGGFQTVSPKAMAGLTQRNDHVRQDRQESNSAKARAAIASDEFVQEGFDARVRGHIKGQGEGNPFADGRTEAQKVGSQSGFGSPSEVLAHGGSGLPSQREYHQAGLPSGTREGREAMKPSGLPSDRR